MTGGGRPAGPEQSERLEKDIPYTLPGDAQLLAYWHYNKAAKPPSDSWVISHKNVESAEAEAEIAAAGRSGARAFLARELRAGRAGGHASFSRLGYARSVRQLSRWRLLLGQRRDACIQLDQRLDVEQRKFAEIKRQYRECAAALERFLSRDHASSMAALERAKAEERRTAVLGELRDDLSRRYGQTRLEVYHWEETWRTARACQRFVLRLAEAPDDEDDQPPGESSPLGEPPVASDFGDDSSLHSLIAAFEHEVDGLSASPAREPADLGLAEPADLLRVFRAMELQNLNALIHLESLGGPMSDMLARIDLAEGRVRREIDDVLEDIQRLEASIEREELRARRLERRCGLLVQRGFRALVCSAEALRVRVLVEDAYEACVAANRAGLEPLAMARGLENAYERLSGQLDLLPAQLVAACEREGFLREMRESREAEDAARKFELMHRLLAGLRRTMEPAEPRRRVLVRRSTPAGRGTRRRPAAKANSAHEPRRDLLFADDGPSDEEDEPANEPVHSSIVE